jgi:hypothetical protein
MSFTSLFPLLFKIFFEVAHNVFPTRRPVNCPSPDGNTERKSLSKIEFSEYI